MLEDIPKGARITLDQQNEIRTYLRGVIAPTDPDGNPASAGSGYGTAEIPAGAIHVLDLYVNGQLIRSPILDVIPGVRSAPDVPGMDGVVGTLGINAQGKPLIRAGTVLTHGASEYTFAADALLPAPPVGADQSATALSVVDTTKQWGYDANWAHSALTTGWLPVFADVANGTLAISPRPCCGHVDKDALPDSGTTGERRLLSNGEWVVWDGTAWQNTTEVLVGVVHYSSLATGAADKVMPTRTQDFDDRIANSIAPRRC